MVHQLRRHQSPRISLASLHDPQRRQHATVNVGKSLRREGMQRKNILILDTEGIGFPGGRPITNAREPFYAACRDLAEEPHPDPSAEATPRSQRSQLTHVLNQRPPRRPTVVRQPQRRLDLKMSATRARIHSLINNGQPGGPPGRVVGDASARLEGRRSRNTRATS
jgi:hypothetical protein